MNIDYHALLPVEILAATILVVLVVDLFLPARAKAMSMWVAMVGLYRPGVLSDARVISKNFGRGRRIPADFLQIMLWIRPAHAVPARKVAAPCRARSRPVRL